MLKRALTSFIAKAKMTVYTALMLVCVLVYPMYSFCQKGANPITYRGNTFEYGPRPNEEVEYLTDAATGKPAGSITRRDSIPAKMNGNRIYRPGELTTQPEYLTESIHSYLFRKIKPTLNDLPDGTYSLDINNIVIDTTGKIVYYDGIGLSHYTDTGALAISNILRMQIDDALYYAPTAIPGTKDSKNVAVLSDIYFMKYAIEVKEHNTIIKQTWK